MSESTEFFKEAVFSPERLFSAENPVLGKAAKVHRGLFEAFDSAARANLSLASDLLDLNRRRVETLYAGKPVAEQLRSQADILLESGQRIVAWSDELRDAANALRAGVADLAEAAGTPSPSARKPRRPTAKTAA